MFCQLNRCRMSFFPVISVHNFELTVYRQCTFVSQTIRIFNVNWYWYCLSDIKVVLSLQHVPVQSSSQNTPLNGRVANTFYFQTLTNRCPKPGSIVRSYRKYVLVLCAKMVEKALKSGFHDPTVRKNNCKINVFALTLPSILAANASPRTVITTAALILLKHVARVASMSQTVSTLVKHIDGRKTVSTFVHTCVCMQTLQ